MPLDKAGKPCYTSKAGSFGEMAERLMALVLKTSDAFGHRGFESLSLRQFSCISLDTEKYPSGQRGSPAKGVVCDKRSMGSNPIFSVKARRTLKIKALLAFYYSAVDSLCSP